MLDDIRVILLNTKINLLRRCICDLEIIGYLEIGNLYDTVEALELLRLKLTADNEEVII